MTTASVAPVAANRPSLWRNRDFRIFMGGQGVSALGDAVSFTALPLLVLFLTGSGVQMGLVGVLQTVPDLLFGLPAGALADRYDRRRMMLAADLGRAALTALIPLSFVLGWDTMTVILIVTAPINLLRVVFMAGFTGALPSLARRDQVGQANSLAEAVFSFSFIIGPAVAGLLVGVIGAAATIAIDAVSFAASAVAMLLISRPLQGERTGERRHLVHEIAEGVRFIWREQTLRMVISFWSVVSIISAPLVPSVIFYLTVDRGQPSQIVGLVVSGYGVGFLMGALLAGRMSRGPLGRLMLSANLASYAALAAFALSEAVPLWLVAAAATGLSGSLVLVSYVTLRGTIPPDGLLGRVGSTARTLSLGLQPIGLLVGGTLLDLVGGRATMLGIAAVAGVATMLFAFSPIMRAARVPVRAAAAS